jgi:peroxiredoxin
MFRTAGIAVLALLAVITGCTNGGAAKGSGPAPDFSLQDLDGRTVRLADLKGKVVLVEFWATWCPPCREAIPSLERLHRTYGGRGLVTLGVSLDEDRWDSVASFARENGITYTVLRGDESVSSAYAVRMIPLTVLVNKEGFIARQYVGGDEKSLERDIKMLL